VQSHAPSTQWNPSQQSASALQRNVRPPQRVQALPLHASSSQHSTPVPPPHRSASFAHVGVHVPPEQPNPEQQSPPDAHCVPVVPHPGAQRPALHPRSAQHSADESQASPSSVQPEVPHVPEAQEPEQQSAPSEHTWPSPRHPKAHSPPWHDRPLQQSESRSHSKVMGAHSHTPRQTPEQHSSSTLQSASGGTQAGPAVEESEPQLPATSATSARAIATTLRRTTALPRPDMIERIPGVLRGVSPSR
jgi:hypothetical protein